MLTLPTRVLGMTRCPNDETHRRRKLVNETFHFVSFDDFTATSLTRRSHRAVGSCLKRKGLEMSAPETASEEASGAGPNGPRLSPPCGAPLWQGLLATAAAISAAASCVCSLRTAPSAQLAGSASVHGTGHLRMCVCTRMRVCARPCSRACAKAFKHGCSTVFARGTVPGAGRKKQDPMIALLVVSARGFRV